MLEILAATAALAAGPALPLKPCQLEGAVEARCGTLAVPEDRRRPNGRRIKLFVAVLPAYGPKPHAEPIVWLAGGPGGAAASDDAGFASSTFLSANRKRDIVLVDQRGVGRSAALTCPSVAATSIEAALAQARKCLRDVGRDPRLYTTDAAMDDVDAVRRALGYRNVVLYGGSYGGSAAQVYLARHGAVVVAAVLDGATLLDVPIWERMPRSTQESFDRVASLCAADAACSRLFPDVPGDLRAVMARLRATPVEVPYEGATIRFGAAEAQGTLRYMLRVPSTAARVPLELRRAASGDFQPLVDRWLSLAEGERGTATKLVYWAIRCAEGWSRADPAEVERQGVGTEFLESARADASAQGMVCTLLGKPLLAPDTGHVPRSRVPVLFLVGGLDPQDPLPNVADARRSLPNAQILVVPGAGHGSIHLGCLRYVAGRFLSSRRLTAADRSCASAVRLPPFATRP